MACAAMPWPAPPGCASPAQPLLRPAEPPPSDSGSPAPPPRSPFPPTPTWPADGGDASHQAKRARGEGGELEHGSDQHHHHHHQQQQQQQEQEGGAHGEGLSEEQAAEMQAQALAAATAQFHMAGAMPHISLPAEMLAAAQASLAAGPDGQPALTFTLPMDLSQMGLDPASMAAAGAAGNAITIPLAMLEGMTSEQLHLFTSHNGEGATGQGGGGAAAAGAAWVPSAHSERAPPPQPATTIQ